MPRGERLSDDKRSALVADYHAGLTYVALARRYGLAKSGVSIILRSEGIMPKRQEDPATLALIIPLYLAGKTAKKIESETGLERHRVIQILRDGGIPIRPKNRKMIETKERLVAERYAAGDNMSVIGNAFKIGRGTIKNIANRYHIPSRPTGTVKWRHFREDAFATITEESAYWIGMLMADGWVISDRGAIGLSLATADGDHVSKFRDFLEYPGPLMTRLPRNGDSGARVLTVYSRRMCQDLARYGVLPRKSLTAQVCSELAFDRDFWRGAIDGDGTLMWVQSGVKRYPSIKLVGSHTMVSQFCDFCRRLSPASRAVVGPKDSIWRFQLTGDMAVPVIRTLYDNANLALPRKAARASAMRNGTQPL